jgi:parallel beta-helix repeat protein
MVLRVVLLIAALILFSESVLAKTLYVDTQNGDDSRTYAQNSPNQPWRTIGRAAWGSMDRSRPNTAEAAQAGDVVSIAAGIYWETGDPEGRRFTVSLNPVNNGTATNPIVFRGEGLVYIRLQAGYRGGMIGCDARNYIVWDNLQIDDYYGGSRSDTGPVVFTGHARHCQIINSDIKGHPGSYYHGYPTFGGNYRGISLEPAHNIIIRNNRIYQFRGGQNEAGVMAYDSNDNIIEHNEFFDNGQAIFIKGVHPGQTQARNIIRYNLVRNNGGGIRVLGSEDARVYQNLVINNNNSGLWAGFSSSTRSQFVNNTVVNSGRGLYVQGSELVGVAFRGNIVANNTSAVFDWTTGSPAQQDVAYDRNLYFNNQSHAFYEGSGTYSFTIWQSTFSLDLNSLQADPRFVDRSRNDFRLQSGSPALTLSRDYLNLLGEGTSRVIPAGAYISGGEVIGTLGEGGQVAGPMPPGTIRIE